MHRLTTKLATRNHHQAVLTLTYEYRQKSRQRVVLEDGHEAGIFLPPGTTLRDGDLLQGEDGYIVLVRAAKERLSQVETDDGLLLLRLAYHLGNRHVPVQIGNNWLRYQQDHVLDDMVRTLGGELTGVNEVFEPEHGAYHTHELPVMISRHTHVHAK